MSSCLSSSITTIHSTYTKEKLREKWKRCLQLSLFYLVEDIKNLAEILSPRFTFTIHCVPSHIESTALGKRPIRGNVEADYLANEGQQKASDRDTLNNICLIRDKILNFSASLVSGINNLLVPDSPSCDGPSSDDFSLSDAIRNISRDVLRDTWLQYAREGCGGGGVSRNTDELKRRKVRFMTNFFYELELRNENYGLEYCKEIL